MGGIPVATMLSQVSGIPTIFMRKKAKKYGTCKLAEGGDVGGRNLLIIEDHMPRQLFVGSVKKYIFRENIYQRRQVREMQKNPRAMVDIIESV
jgi:hypothetical protein